MVVGIEHLGCDVSSAGSLWENEFREHFERRLEEQKVSQTWDRNLEKNQKLEKRVRTSQKELKQLRRDNELLLSENELLRSQVKEREETGQSLAPIALSENSETSLRYASFMLPKFSGTDPSNYSRTWLKAIQKCQNIFSWTDPETLLAARVSLEGPARQWLTTQRRDVTTWKEFKQVFETRFEKEETAVKRIHLALTKRKWMPHESISEYVNYVEEMAQRIALEDSYIKEYLINGFVPDPLVRSGLQKIASLEELKTVMAQYGEVKYLEDVEDQPATKPTEKSCYNCKETGHHYSNCQRYSESGFFGLAILVFIILFIIGL